jgi:hypothetical protein
MCDCHRNSNNQQPRATNASRFSPPPLLRRQSYFIMFINMHVRLGEQVSKIIVLSDHAPGEGEEVFCEVIFVTA